MCDKTEYMGITIATIMQKNHNKLINSKPNII